MSSLCPLPDLRQHLSIGDDAKEDLRQRLLSELKTVATLMVSQPNDISLVDEAFDVLSQISLLTPILPVAEGEAAIH